MTFYGDIDDNLTSDDDSNRSLNLRNPEHHNLLSHDLEVSEASSISAPRMSPLSSVVSLSSESSQNGDEIQVREEVRPQTAEKDSTQCEETSHEWQGFKIVGDNIDKTVRPRHQTTDSPTQSCTTLTVTLFKIASTSHPIQIQHQLSTLKQFPWTVSCQPKMIFESSSRALQSTLLGC